MSFTSDQMPSIAFRFGQQDIYFENMLKRR